MTLGRPPNKYIGPIVHTTLLLLGLYSAQRPIISNVLFILNSLEQSARHHLDAVNFQSCPAAILAACREESILEHMVPGW